MSEDPRLASRAESLFAALLVDEPEGPGGLERRVEELAREHPELAGELEQLVRQWRLFKTTQERLVDAAPSRGSASSSVGFAFAGARIGRFELVRLLGRGGMGEVWEAEERDLKRRVALKLLPSGSLPSPEDLARFRREAEATGRVRHPGIVAVHSAGELDGRLYIAYELVEGGRSLRTWLDERAALAELAPEHFRETAELFARLAEALEAAHAAGIVHRDLKPQNVLLSADGAPKVADFGLAKVAGELSLSQSGAFVGTWYYASPEQVRGEALDARSDVFSLGVTLYECLTLRRPFAGDTRVQLVAQILGDEPPDPRSVRSRCPADLAVIVAKALEKSRERRYPSMRAFADDLRRHLAHQPILARAPSAAERLGKWSRRHPTATTAIVVSALGFVALAGLFVRSEGLRREAEAANTRERATNASLVLANHELELARLAADHSAAEAFASARTARDESAVREEVIRFLTDTFEAASPDVSPDEDPPASVLLARATDRLRSTSVIEPRVRAGLLVTLGKVYEKLGKVAEARELLYEAFELCGGFERDLGTVDEFSTDAERVRLALATVCMRTGESAFGLALVRPVVERALADSELDCENVLDRVAYAARLEADAGRFAESEAVLARAEPLLASLPAADEPAALQFIEARASLYLWTERFELAESDLRRAVELHERIDGPNNPRTINPLNTLGLLLRATGRLEESERAFADCVERSERSFEPDHPDLLVIRGNLASVWMESGRAKEAVTLLERALELRRTRAGERDMLYLWLSNQLGSACFQTEEFLRAESIHRATLVGREALLGVEHPNVQESRNNLAYALYRQQKYAEAEAVQVETLARTAVDAPQRAGRQRLLDSIRKAAAGGPAD
ncbi:MAG: tetratricopeptide repeat protein [Planctomycetes bacterium]|nr:tetratricopeptide repeat protein [Planctomycetota bacterium]